MVLIAPKIESFGEQLAKGIGQGAGQGIANAPSFALELLKAKREREAKYGGIGQQLFASLNPNATPKELADAYEIASKMQKPNEQPGEMIKRLAEHATEYKNKLARAEQYAIPETIFEKGKRFLMEGQTPADIKKAQAKLPKALEGIDKLRQIELLQKKGLGPESIEAKVNPLSENVNKIIESFPVFAPVGKQKIGTALKGKGIGSKELAGVQLNDEQKDYFRKSLERIYKEDPNANLLNLRKQFEDKGIGWRDFRDAIEYLEDTGQIDLTQEDHARLKNKIYKPPSGGLSKLLHNLKLVER